MVDLYRHVTRSIKWNALEAMSYQFLLLAHQVALFSVTDHGTYGLIGSLFSISYLIVMITNFGFDVTLGPFFSMLTKSRQHFKKIFFIQLLPEYFIVSMLFIVGLIIQMNFFPMMIPDSHFGIFIYPILGLLVLFESAKKTFRMILQLAFLTHKTTIIEIATIISYTGIVWCGYLLGFPISLNLVFLPMLITSAISTCILGLWVHEYFQTLPDSTASSITTTLQLRILKSRFFNFLNQASHMIFSSNFLVPFFALFFGFNRAGVLKLVSSITHCITIILQKVFGLSSALLLSHIKDMQLATKQQAFLFITNRLNQVLYGIIIFLCINYGTLLSLSAAPHAHSTVTIAYLFLILSFSESFFIAYEKFYITEEKSDHLFIFNLLVIGLLSIVIWHASNFSQLGMLLAIMAIRIIAFSCISAASFYHWQIRPALKPQPLYIASALVISCAFYLLAHT